MKRDGLSSRKPLKQSFNFFPNTMSYKNKNQTPTRTIKALAPVECPQHPFARVLVLFMSLAVFALLLCALNFVFRELYMDVFITQTELDKVVVKSEYIDVWLVGLRFDAKLAYYLMLPGIAVSLLGALGPAFFRLCLKILGVWVTLSVAWLMATTCANIHVLSATGMPLTAAQVDLFLASPFTTLSGHPIFFDTIMTVVVTGLFLGLWHRLTTIFSTSGLWNHENWINWLICLCCFFGLVWTSAQTYITSTDPLTPAHARISKIPMVNYIVMNAPMSIHYSDSHALISKTE